jgi:hypothetical protein
MIASQEHAVACSVLVEAWAPNSGKDPLSYFEWCLEALATSRLFRPSGRVGLVWERGARALHLYPFELVDGRKRQLSAGCTRCDKNRQELHADSFLAVRALVQPKLWYCVCLGVWERGAGHHT